MVNFIEAGNIFSIEGVSNYAHGCNCAGAMGKGIALEFKRRFPEMYREYRKRCLRKEFRPGDVFGYCYGDGYVYNLATQLRMGPHATLDNIRNSIRLMLEMANENEVRDIALPAIGAGIGGLNWADVKKVIVEEAGAYPDITLHVVESFKAD
ncbi:MAG: macro domain-containing protein [Bacteroides sp.]|nr:macro domain-containing protein [Bacteroides sp.]